MTKATEVAGSAPVPNLDRSLASGIAWTGAIRWTSQIFSWVGTLVAARLLVPEDFGIVGMATLYLGLAERVGEFGLGAAIVRQQTLTPYQTSALGGLSVLWAALVAGISVPAAWPLAAFFDEPRLRVVLPVLSLSLVLTSLRVPARSLLLRDLSFRRVALIDAIQVVAATIAIVVLAWLGWHHWAIIIGNLTGLAVSCGLALRWRWQRLALPRRGTGLQEPVRFGASVFVARFAWYVYNNADGAVIGRVLGKEALGIYSFAGTLAALPVERITALVRQVTPAVFSAVQKDPVALRRYLLTVTEGLALVALPLAVGLALVAENLVVVALGETWRPAIVPLQVLTIFTGLRSITAVFAEMLSFAGRIELLIRVNIGAALLMPLLFLAGARQGVVGVAAAWAVGYPLVAWVQFEMVRRLIGLRPGEYFGACRPALVGLVIMVGAVLVAQQLRPSQWSPAVGLAVDTGIGVLTYGGYLLTAQRSRLRQFVELARSAKS